ALTRGRPDVPCLAHRPLRLVGVAFLAPSDGKPIALAAVHYERNGLGGLAQGNRQASGGERIERAGVARAFGLEQPLHDRHRMRRGHANRLVEHDPAVDVALVAPRLALLLLLVTAGVVVASYIREIIFFRVMRI